MSKGITEETTISNILKDKARSICPICYIEIDAQIIEKDGGVYLIKECTTHGKFDILIEKDPSFYKRLMNREFLEYKIPFTNLAISVTHLCDSNCNICYLPQRDNYDFTLEDIKKVVSEFTGKFIWLTGGEPGLKKDLPQIIEYIVNNGKEPILLTNGKRLADLGYVKKLKNAGLKRVHFSFNGFSDKVYEKINAQKLLKIKLKALRNLNRAKILTALSIMLVKGVNEKELGRVFRYCLKNNSFISELRIRSSTHIGRHTETECLFLSEIVKIISKIIGISEDKLLNHSLEKGKYYSRYFTQHHMPCHLEIDLFSLLMDEMKIERIGNSLPKKIQAAFELLPKVGLKNLIKMFLRKLAKKKRLLEFNIRIRVWPDKYRIDLGEIQRCPSGYITSDGKRILPFCYALILNETTNIL